MWILLKLKASVMWKYFLPLLKRLLTAEFAVAVAAVEKAMLASKTMTGTPQEKRDMIFQMVVKDFTAQGLVVSYSLIYEAIRAVVKKESV